MYGPIVKCCRIEIGSVRPYQGASFPIQSDLSKKRQIVQRTENLSLKDRTEMDPSFRAIIKLHLQCVGSHD
jgi:hypothetical protein